ncbi:hypothetical protein ACFQZE_14115 [Paenibacillus sp. GCM10027627]|uniref:hypothetical protein n=1 Tax=unclassified Paenibacillus TaxID=185978 RepID=UPI0036440EA1
MGAILDSAAIIVSIGGIYFGAWFGTKMANKQKEAEQLKADQETKKAYLHILNDEIRNNKKLLQSMKSYQTRNPAIENAFDPILVGSTHLQSEAWNLLVASKVFAMLTGKQQINYQLANNAAKEVARIVQMEVAEWKRIYAFYEFSDRNMGLYNISELDLKTYEQINRHLEKTISDNLRIIKMVCEKISNNWDDNIVIEQ